MRRRLFDFFWLFFLFLQRFHTKLKYIPVTSEGLVPTQMSLLYFMEKTGKNRKRCGSEVKPIILNVHKSTNLRLVLFILVTFKFLIFFFFQLQFILFCFKAEYRHCIFSNDTKRVSKRGKSLNCRMLELFECLTIWNKWYFFVYLINHYEIQFFFFFQLQVECEEVGTLSKLRVGHDNKGMGAAWFLDKVRGFQIKSPNQMKRLVAIGHFQKKNCTPPCWGYQFFWSWLPGFPVKFTVTSLWNFPFFLHWPSPPPGNLCFFLNFLCTPLEFQRLLLYPLEFSIDILNRGGGTIFFWKSPLSFSNSEVKPTPLHIIQTLAQMIKN